MNSTKKIARRAGLLYFLFSLPGPFALVYVPNKLFVKGDVTATADRIRSFGALLRMGIAAELIGFAGFIFVALTLYRLFKPVDEGSALAMLVLGVVSAPISFVCVLAEVAAQELAGAGGVANLFSALDPGQRDALAYLALRLHNRGFTVAGVFWGLWLFPFALCVIRSGFIPRVLGVLLMIAGCGYVAGSFTRLALPQYADAVGQVASFLMLAELPIIFWLLIWGAKPRPAAIRAS